MKFVQESREYKMTEKYLVTTQNIHDKDSKDLAVEIVKIYSFNGSDNAFHPAEEDLELSAMSVRSENNQILGSFDCITPKHDYLITELIEKYFNKGLDSLTFGKPQLEEMVPAKERRELLKKYL